MLHFSSARTQCSAFQLSGQTSLGRDDHEGWRDCLTKLCSNYLGSESKEDRLTLVDTILQCCSAFSSTTAGLRQAATSSRFTGRCPASAGGGSRTCIICKTNLEKNEEPTSNGLQPTREECGNVLGAWDTPLKDAGKKSPVTAGLSTNILGPCQSFRFQLVSRFHVVIQVSDCQMSATRRPPHEDLYRACHSLRHIRLELTISNNAIGSENSDVVSSWLVLSCYIALSPSIIRYRDASSCCPSFV